jgi:iron complex outermembrane receptor protein
MRVYHTASRLTSFALAASLLLTPGVLHAQTTFRQDVVVTAAASPVELGSVTRTLTIITRQEIAELPVHSVADVLRLAASVDVHARGERGSQVDFAVRGANFGQMLVLVDGVRLNDAQSGHHNGDIPVPLDAIERIEILHGPGSSLFGADAFGGTINVITRRQAERVSGAIEAGSFGLVAGRVTAGAAINSVRETVAASVDRSSGFMFERGFVNADVSSRTAIGDRSDVLVSFLSKDFGANQFYGNAPSHEWTDQTLVSASHRFVARAGWQLGADASYRTHGDRFLFNVRTPGVSENFHRTHAARGALKASRAFGQGTVVTVGGEAGADWIRSTNLGDHTTERVSGFGEWRRALGPRTQVDASLRVDRYTEFGSSWSPAAGIGVWASRTVRLRASAGRAFRVPTFTERYYHDPANLARPDVGPETAWAGEAGADVFLADGWSLGATVFGRNDHDVIDWLRPDATALWQTYNIRDVDTLGLELTAKRALAGGSFVQVGYTRLDLDAAAVNQQSKYVLDYAPHSFVAGAMVRLPAALRLAPRLEYKHRTRSTGVSDYAVLDLRVSRGFGNYEIRIDGTNLFDASYQEVLNVQMPGAAVSVSLAARLR